MRQTQVEPRFKPPPPARDRGHVAFVRRLPCCHCGKAAPSQAHHLQLREAGRGLGRRTSDYMTVPMCWPHHQDHPESLHTIGERIFWNGRDPVALAMTLEGCSGDVQAGTAAVRAWRNA